MDVLEITVPPAEYAATISGQRKAHPLIRTAVIPQMGDAVRIREVKDGHYTTNIAWARITWVDTLTGPIGPMHVVSLDVRMSTDRAPALGDMRTPVPE